MRLRWKLRGGRKRGRGRAGRGAFWSGLKGERAKAESMQMIAMQANRVESRRSSGCQAARKVQSRREKRQRQSQSVLRFNNVPVLAAPQQQSTSMQRYPKHRHRWLPLPGAGCRPREASQRERPGSSALRQPVLPARRPAMLTSRIPLQCASVYRSVDRKQLPLRCVGGQDWPI